MENIHILIFRCIAAINNEIARLINKIIVIILCKFRSFIYQHIHNDIQ